MSTPGEQSAAAAPAACPDCEQSPCLCAEWQRQFDRTQEEDAERLATFAETCIPELWHPGPGGLLVRNR